MRNNVNVSATAPNVATSTTYTRFTFDSPVYLYPDEYAVVLTSPSENYSVHVANLGETVRNTTDTKVSQQPFVASSTNLKTHQSGNQTLRNR